MSDRRSFEMRSFAELLPMVEERIGTRNGSHRFHHTMGVVATAEQLAIAHGADVEKAKIAALLHDVSKHDAFDAQRKLIAQHYGESFARSWPNQLLHGFTAAIYAKETCGIDDPDILAAIENHSVGRPGMSLLEKIVFAADFLEPGRGKDPAGIRELALVQLDRAIAKIIRFSLDHVRKMGYEIAPLSLETQAFYDPYLEDAE